jgi:hypothetical protein
MGQENSHPQTARFQNKIDFSKIYNENKKINGKHESIYILITKIYFI